jgi:hypothetical protein
MTMQMEGVRRYFDKWYGRERPSTPTSAPTSGSTFAQTRDRRRIEALRGTNAPALLQGLSKLIQEGARRDHEGTITNSHLQSTLAALKGVSTLMEKNERNEALSDLQVKDLIAQLDKLIQFQQDVQRKDPRYSNEARLRESLARKAKEKDGFTRDQLEALMSGKKREDDKNRKGRNPWEDTPFKQSLRHLLYAATGPLGPVFQSLDEVLVSLKDVKTKMASALSKVGSGLNWVGSKIEKGFSAFTGFGMRFLLMMKGFWGRLTGMSGGDGRGGLLGAGARLLAGGAGALLRGGGAILRGGGRLLGRGIGWLGRGAAAVGGSIVGGARRLGVRGGLRGLGVLGGIAGLGYGLHDQLDRGRDPNETTADRASTYGSNALSGALTGASLGAFMGPIGIAIGAAIGGASGLIMTYVTRNWTEIKDWTSKLWDGAKDTFDKGLMGLKDMWSNGLTSLKETWSNGIDGLKGLWGKFTDFAGSLVPESVRRRIEGVVDAARDAGRRITDTVAPIVEPIRAATSNFVANTVIPAATNAGRRVQQTVGEAAVGFQNQATQLADSMPRSPILRAAVSGVGRMVGNLAQPTDDVRAAIMNAARATGVDPGYLMAMTRQESGFNPNARARTSSAAGLNQFIDGTWATMVRQYGQQYGIGMGDRMDPRANAMMGALFARDNRQQIEGTLGRRATSGELYMAHFMGAGGANQFFRAMQRDPNAAAADMMPAAAAANRSIYYTQDGRKRTMQEVYQLLNNKIEPYAQAYGAQEAAVPPRATLAEGKDTGSWGREARTTGMQPGPITAGASGTSVASIPTYVEDTGLILANSALLG